MKEPERLGLLRFFLVKFPPVHDTVDLNETFDYARRRSYRRAALVMYLQQCRAALSSTAITRESRSREPPANERRDSFALTFECLGQLSRADGPRSEKG